MDDWKVVVRYETTNVCCPYRYFKYKGENTNTWFCKQVDQPCVKINCPIEKEKWNATDEEKKKVDEAGEGNRC